MMKRALELAEKGLGRTSPNPAVGAVVVRGGRIVGEGYHEYAGGPHAEAHALDQAGEAARGADLYVTLEPCAHHGRTPPCTERIIAAQVRRVVIAGIDPNPLVRGKGVQALQAAGIEVEVGLCAQEAERLNEAYGTAMRLDRPFVHWKAAMSLDGKVATRTGASRWITGEAARAEVHRQRALHDAVAVGVGTALADDPLLTARPHEAFPRQPLRLVVDTHGRLPPTAACLDPELPSPLIVASTDLAPEERRAALERAGAHVWRLPASRGRVDVAALLERLHAQQIRSVYLEGGPTLAASFFEAGCLDRVTVFIAPLLIGGKDAPTPLEGMGAGELAEAWRLEDVEGRPYGEDWALTGRVRREVPQNV